MARWYDYNKVKLERISFAATNFAFKAEISVTTLTTTGTFSRLGTRGAGGPRHRRQYERRGTLQHAGNNTQLCEAVSRQHFHISVSRFRHFQGRKHKASSTNVRGAESFSQ